MQIEINDNYRISTDPHNYILEEKHVAGEKSAEPGAVRWNAVGFYSSLGGSINGCLSWSVKTEDLRGVQEVRNYLDTLGSEILKSLQKHFEGVV